MPEHADSQTQLPPLHDPPLEHVPQLPPHPSLPQVFPLQFGTQGLWHSAAPVAGLSPQIFPKALQLKVEQSASTRYPEPEQTLSQAQTPPSQVPPLEHDPQLPPHPSLPQFLPLQSG